MRRHAAGLVAADVVVWPVSAPSPPRWPRRRPGWPGTCGPTPASPRRRSADSPSPRPARRSTGVPRCSARPPASCLAGLDALAAGAPARTVLTGAVASRGAGPLFRLPGHRPGGRGGRTHGPLPGFDDALAECRQALAPWVDVDPAALLTSADASWGEQPELARPVLFAVGWRSPPIWRHAGLAPGRGRRRRRRRGRGRPRGGPAVLPDAARTVALLARAAAGELDPDGLRVALAGLPPQPGTARLASTVTGDWADSATLGADTGPTPAPTPRPTPGPRARPARAPTMPPGRSSSMPPCAPPSTPDT